MKILCIEKDGTATIKLDAQHCATLARATRMAADDWDDDHQTEHELLASLFEALTMALGTYGHFVVGDDWTLATVRKAYRLTS